MSNVTAAAFVFLLFSSAVTYAADGCKYDEEVLLALDENAFDQGWSGVGGGWRAIASIPGCELAAADLLAAYQAKHPHSNSILAWHEGQMRASAGQYERAIPLLESARKPADQDLAGWNYYVDASVAFLRHDKARLLDARRRLAAVPFPEKSGMPPLKDGIIELPTQPGQPNLKMRWPMNIDVVDGLIACFDKPYSEAYAPSCRPPPP
jgi:hypothetical protein